MRIRQLVRHLRSRRGTLIVAAVLFSVSSVMTPEPVSTVLVIATVGVTAAVLLLLSVHLSQIHALISRPTTETQTRPTESPNPPTSPSQVISGPSPLVTLVVPIYNDSKNVSEAIASIRAQSFEDWECIVVDDASTDGSLRTVWLAVRGDPRFRIVRHRVNGGLSASRNTGLRLARGRFVSFLDSDDLLMRRSIEDRLLALGAVIEDPHVVGSYTGVAHRSNETRPEDLPTAMTWDDAERLTVDFITARGECPFPAMAPLMRTVTLRGVGGFDEAMGDGAEDWDLWQRLLRNGYVFVPSTFKTAVYRQRPGSMVRENSQAHAITGIGLIEQSYADVDRTAIRFPSPTPLSRSIDFYSKRLAQSRRAIRFAAMSYQGGGPEPVEHLLEPLSDLPLSLLTRHVDVTDEIMRGLARTKPSSATNGIPDGFDEIRDLVLSKTGPPESVPSASPKPIDLILIPQHAAHLREMLTHVTNEHPGARYEVLLLEREGGDQGVRDVVPSHVKIRTLNEWILGGYRADNAVVGRIRSWVVEEVAHNLSLQGSRVIEVDDAYSDVKAIPEAPPRASTLTGSPTGDTDSKRLEVGLSVIENWHREEDPDTWVDFDDIRRFRDTHRGERAVIIGNGPSINMIDLTLLEREFTFGVNGIFYASDRMGFDPTFYVVEDSAVVDDNLQAIRDYRAGHKFFPSIYREKIGDQPNTSYFMMNRSFYAPDSLNFCVPNFAADCTGQIFCGQSVTIINLQLAFHMGFKEVILIGMDFSYTIPDDAEQSGYQIRSQGPDPNHFHPDYFGKGKTWKQPKLDRVLASYALAKQVYESAGRRIVNATPGGELHLFDRVPYENLFK